MIGEDPASQNLVRVVMAYRGYHIPEPILPPLYVIEPTNVCNYRCIMCPNRYYPLEEKGCMEWSLYTSIINQIADVARSVLLHWVGESLLHPHLVDMIGYLKQCSRANIILSTNASVLTEARAVELIDSGLDELIIALDADSSQTYESIRVLGKWVQVVRNVESFFDILGRRQQPKVILQMIRMQANDKEAESFVERWSKYPCEPLVTWLDTWANQFPEMATWSDYLCPNRLQPRQACAEIWFKMVVNWRGQVVICCHDWSWQNVMGDLNEQSVEEIWNGETLGWLRQLHREGEYDRISICKSCFEWSMEEEQYEFFALSSAERQQLNVPYTRRHRS